jgi:hypothetical protein
MENNCSYLPTQGEININRKHNVFNHNHKYHTIVTNSISANVISATNSATNLVNIINLSDDSEFVAEFVPSTNWTDIIDNCIEEPGHTHRTVKCCHCERASLRVRSSSRENVLE